jgi:hypothetical protein
MAGISQVSHPEKFTARHWLAYPVSPPTGYPFAAVAVVSGIAMVDFTGAAVGGDWKRDTINLDVTIDCVKALNQMRTILPPAQPEFSTVFSVPREPPGGFIAFSTVNARFNAGPAVNDGSAVDYFALNDWPGIIGFASAEDTSAGGLILRNDVAIRDSDAWLYRIGYQIQLYGQVDSVYFN